MRNPTLAERFWPKVDMAGECWLWTAYRNAQGYGHFRVGQKIEKAHRVAYELLVGPIADSLELDHLCRTPACVRPAHLEPVTKAENLRRVPPEVLDQARLKSNAVLSRADATHCIHGHEYTEANVVYHRGKRKCRECSRLWSKAKRERQRQLSA